MDADVLTLLKPKKVTFKRIFYTQSGSPHAAGVRVLAYRTRTESDPNCPACSGHHLCKPNVGNLSRLPKWAWKGLIRMAPLT